MLYSTRSQSALFDAPFWLQLRQSQKKCSTAWEAASARVHASVAFRLPRFAQKCAAKKAHILTASSIFFVGLVVSGKAPAESPVGVPFGEPSYRGTGCHADSVAFGPTEDAFTILFDRYTVEDGPAIQRSHRDKFCRLTIPITVPEGQQVSVESVDYRGFAGFEENAWGWIFSSFRLGHAPRGGSPTTFLKGPLEVDFFRRDVVRDNGSKWSRCGGVVSLKIYNRVRVRSFRGHRALIQMDSIDGVIQFKIRTRRCR